jgi:hypothetical protein
MQTPSDALPTPPDANAADAATAARARKVKAPPLGQQRRGQSLNDQQHPTKGPDMDNQPSTPSVTETFHLGDEEGPRRIAFDIDLSLLRYDGTVCTVALTAAEARRTAIILLDMAADVERIAATRGRP